MQKIIFIISIAFIIVSRAYAARLNFGQYELKLDFHLNGRIDSTNYTRVRTHVLNVQALNNEFCASYILVDMKPTSNKSIFQGRVLSVANPSRNTKLIQFTQNGGLNFWRIFQGYSIGNNSYRGTWYSVTGESGDFEMHYRGR